MFIPCPSAARAMATPRIEDVRTAEGSSSPTQH
jgi:hypothetical protein